MQRGIIVAGDVWRGNGYGCVDLGFWMFGFWVSYHHWDREKALQKKREGMAFLLPYHRPARP